MSNLKEGFKEMKQLKEGSYSFTIRPQSGRTLISRG